MDSQKKYSNNHGRKPKTDKMRHRYVFRLSDEDNARFLALFDESGKATRAEFIVSALFGREIKVVKLDKGTQDFYMRLTSFHSQFRSIGVNYNQCVRALKSNFSEKKALAFLYKLERHTLEAACTGCLPTTRSRWTNFMRTCFSATGLSNRRATVPTR